MAVNARLFDADGHDTLIDLTSDDLPEVDERRLLWIDLDRRDPAELERLAPQLGFSPKLRHRLVDLGKRPQLVQYPEHIHLSVRTMDDPDEESTDEVIQRPEALDLVAGKHWVLTVHDGPIPAIDRIIDGIEGETQLGALDADGFLAAIVDSVIVGYYRVIERIEGDIDRLDDAALRHGPGDDVLAKIVAMRRRISRVRQALTPHREAFAVLARPDFALHEELGQPWPGVLDRLEGAIDSVEQMRESLLGTYDIFMGRSSQRDSQVVTTLTILSAILLPAVVIAGVMGMNFKLPFFDDASNFWVALGLMATLAVSILALARWRRWV